MRLSREKINHLSKLIAEDLARSPDVELLAEPNDVRLQVVRAMTQELHIDEEIDLEVRRILSSYSKLMEASREWDILYLKHYEREAAKRRV